MKPAVPWWMKIAAKVALSRLPIPYRLWNRFGLFKHGNMNRPEYSTGVFLSHFGMAGFDGRSGYACLELGPGDSLFSAMIARASGATRCWLIDNGDFAQRDMAIYRSMAQHLEQLGLIAPSSSALVSVDTLLAHCNATYLTNGVKSLSSVPDSSVDLIWSHAVLEHIRRRDFDTLLREMRRILRQGGVCSHTVDLQDHLGGALNNLRFPEWLWEANWFARSGFYTNRIGYSEMLARFKTAGFAADLRGRHDFPAVPTPRAKLARPFRNWPNDELRVAGFSVILR